VTTSHPQGPAVPVGAVKSPPLHHGVLRRVQSFTMAHVEKVLASLAPVSGLAMRPVQRRHVRECAALYRALASQKRLALALDLDQANASRLVNGKTPSAAARFAEDVERLTTIGVDATPLLIYMERVLRDASLAHPGRKSILPAPVEHAWPSRVARTSAGRS
jgi:hypothetical protein